MSNETRFSNRMRIVSSSPNASVVINNAPDDATGGGEMDLAAAQSDSSQEELQNAYQQGWSECETQLNGQIQALTQQLQAEREQLPAALNAYFQELEQQFKLEVLDLAFAISEIIIRREVSEKDIISSVIQESMGQIMNVKGVKVQLNPETASNANFAAESGIPAGVEILPDPQLGPGEAMIQCDQGFIDATIHGRLATLKENLEKELQSSTT